MFVLWCEKVLSACSVEGKMNISTLFKSIPVLVCSAILCLGNASLIQSSPLSQSNHNKQISDKAMPTHEVNGIRYQFAGCKQSGENLSCAVLLTSLTQDRNFELYGSSEKVRLIDLQGNQYLPKDFQFGNHGKRFWRDYVDLVKGVPLRIVIHFEGIPTNLNRASLLQVRDGKLKNLSF